MESLLDKLALLIGLVIGITVHECAHAWSANQLGDPTARRQGRITLNPIAHLDPLGSLLMLYSLLGGFGIGWGKPTPVNPVYLKYGPRTGMAIVSVAGPISNLLVATLFALPLHLNLPLPGALALLLVFIAIANISLAVFNIIPIPPLDGFSVLMGILGLIRTRWSHDISQLLLRVQAQGPLVLLLILALDWFNPAHFSILGSLMGPPFRLLYHLILGS